MAGEIDPHAQVSHESNGRVLSGVGVSVERLEDAMERHAPKEPEPVAPKGTPDAPSGEVGAAAPSRGRQRFADLTKERDEARDETAREKSAREAAERELAELRAQRTQPREEPKPEPKKPEKFPKLEEWAADPKNAGKDWEDYADERQDWRMGLRAGETDQRIRDYVAGERAEQEFLSAARSAQDRGRKAYADFDTVLNSPAGKIPMGPTPEQAMQRAQHIIEHPQSEHVQYAILKDEALARRLNQASDYEFGAIIAGLVPTEKPRATWTPPPSPHPTVGAHSRTETPTSGELAGKGDYEAYRARRAQERGVKLKQG